MIVALIFFFLTTATPVMALPPSPSNMLTCSVPTVRNNSLTNGLAFLWLTLSGLQYDLVNHIFGTRTAITPVASIYGEQTPLTSGSLVAPTFSEGRAVGGSSLPGTGKGGLAMFVIANPTASGSVNSRGIVQSGNSPSYNTPEIDINFNVDETGTIASSVFSLTSYDTVSSTGARNNGALGFIDGNYHLFGGQVDPINDPNIYSVWGDGQNLTNFTTTSPGPLDARGNYVGIGIYPNNSETVGANASFVEGAIWNRPLTAAEWVILNQYPIQSLVTCK